MKRSTLICLILIVAAAIKYFWFLPQSLFEADQEYLALSGQDILKGKLTLIGAPTSVGVMFIGPLYNYIVAFFLWLFQGNPLVINGLSACWATLTILLLFIAGKKLYGMKAGVAAAAFALFSENFMNTVEVPPLLFPLPILTLVFLLTAKSSLTRRKKSTILGAVAGLALNLHFSGIFYIPLLLVYPWLWAISLAIFLSPLILFDIRHHFFITGHLAIFLTGRTGEQSLLSYRLDTFIGELVHLLSPLTMHMALASALALIAMALLLRKKKLWEFFLLVSPLCFFLFYSGHLLPYYSIVAWPIVYLSVGWFLSRCSDQTVSGTILVMISMILFAVPNITSWSKWDSGRSIDKKIGALEFIQGQSQGNPVYVSKTIEPAADFGFAYLIPYIVKNSSGNVSDPNYTLVIPFHWQGIQPDVRFGDIGVVLPKR